MRFIKKLIFGIIVIAFFIVAISMSVVLLNVNDYGVTQFGDTSLIIIGDEISSPKYKEGDLVIVESKSINDIQINDEIFIYKINEDNGADVILGNIGEVFVDEEVVAYENGVSYSMKFVAGEGTKVYEEVGKYLEILQSTWIFFFVIVVPCFLIFIYQIYALIIEIKFGDKDTPVKKQSYF